MLLKRLAFRSVLPMLCLSFAQPVLAQAAPSPTATAQDLQATETKALALHEAKHYIEAAALLEPFLTAGPGSAGDDWRQAMYNLACMEARAGQKAPALDALEASQSNGGGGFSADRISKDDDLLSLHGDPRFERVLSEGHARERLWNTEPGENLPYTPVPSEDEKVAALSTIWSEARFSFAFFDRQPALDWNQLYMDTLPKVRAAGSTAELYRVLIRFAAQLHDGHTNVYPPDAVADLFYSRPGLRMALIDGQVAVTELRDPALAAAGWKVGDVLERINGTDVRAYAEQEVKPYVSASTPQDLQVRMFNYQLLSGDAAQVLTLTVRDAAGHEATRTLKRLTTQEQGKLPPREGATFAVRPDGVAMLTINEFEDSKGGDVLFAHLAEVRAAKGLLIDLRANGGGSTDVRILRALARDTVRGPLQRTREFRAVDRPWGSLPGWADIPQETVSPDAEHHIEVPVAVLTGAQTYSAAEDFVAAFDAMHRGVTVGEPTGGSTGQPLLFKLPGGGSARVCAKNDRAPDGTVFEGVGLIPTEMVHPTLASLRSGADPVADKAASVLLERH